METGGPPRLLPRNCDEKFRGAGRGADILFGVVRCGERAGLNVGMHGRGNK